MTVFHGPAGSHWQLGPTPSTKGSGAFKLTSLFAISLRQLLRPMIILPESEPGLLRECEVEAFRSSGPAGQHVNKTESAVLAETANFELGQNHNMSASDILDAYQHSFEYADAVLDSNGSCYAESNFCADCVGIARRRLVCE